ncbi:MAG: hypothetical protein RSB93_06960 [Rikenellaceae bacterium]
MVNNEYLLSYEKKLSEILIGQCTSKGFLDFQLLEVEELDEIWHEVAPEYMVDAVPQVNDYPAVAIAWAAYIGMGMAKMWDKSWEVYKNKENRYAALRDPRGFDAMDEYISEELLGLSLSSKEYKSIEDLLRECAHTAMNMMRNEKIEPQSTEAFYIFAHTTNVFFRLGVAIELKKLGYKYEKVQVSIPNIS